MRSSNEEVMRNLEDRRNRLAIECDKAHRAWRDSEDATGTFDKWTAAIEELNETEQALILMDRIIRKEEAKQDKLEEAAKELKAVDNLEDAKPGDEFIIYDEEENQWGTSVYTLVTKSNNTFTLKNLSNAIVFVGTEHPYTPIHITKKAGE